ncbi:MAG TPA: DnaT-like ssDNA-binding protein [Blastocatellia bacterium]|nr:DnaT-like ssDNA-binding protein [Blastocatellia bacterium]
MPTLITIIGGETCNSYCTLAEADQILDERLSTDAWRDAVPDDRERALIMAARRLDQELWLGDRVKTTQRLAWPRIGVEKRDPAGIGYGDFVISTSLDWYPSDAIPELIKQAQVLLALAYLEGFRETGERIREHSMDGLTVKKDFERSGLALPVEVQQLIDGLALGGQLQRG